MSTKIVALLEHLLLTVDVLGNAFGDFLGNQLINRLAVYVVQDLCLILSLIIFFLLFFRSKILKNGLLKIILKQQCLPFISILVYIALTITFQYLVVSLTDNKQTNNDRNSVSWKENDVAIVFFFIQRIASVFYYFSYRTALGQLHNPRLIESTKEMNSVTTVA